MINSPPLPAALIAMAIWLASPFALADDLHEWTSTGGTTINAEFMRLSGGKVTLLTDKGKQMVIRMEQLDAKSQSRAERLSELAESDTQEPDSKYRVALFEEGPWKGYHAVYEREKFFAAATRAGQLHIFQKKDGKRIKGGQPAVFRLTTHYHISITEGRGIAYVESDAAPSMNPKELSFSGKTGVGTAFQVTFVFDGDSIEAYGHLRERGRPEHPTRLHVGVRFPKNKAITLDMSIEEQEKLVGDSWIKADTRRGGDIEFDFVTETAFRKHEDLVGGLDSATVKHADCGPHLFKFTPPEIEHGRTTLWNASAIPPHAGFSVSLYRSDTENRSAKAFIRVTVE